MYLHLLQNVSILLHTVNAEHQTTYCRKPPLVNMLCDIVRPHYRGGQTSFIAKFYNIYTFPPKYIVTITASIAGNLTFHGNQ